MQTRTKGKLSLLTCGLLFAIFPTFTRMIAHSFSNEATMFLRSLLLLLMMCAYFLIKRKKPALALKPMTFALLLGLITGLEEYFATFAVNRTTIFQAISSIYFGIIFGNFLAALLLKEKIYIFQILSLPFAIVGLILMFNTTTIIIAAVSAAIATGLFISMRGIINKLLENNNLFNVLFYQFVGMSFMSTVLLLLSSNNAYFGFHSVSFVGLFLFTVCYITLSYLFIYGYQNTTMVTAIFLTIIEIPLSMLFGKIFFGENLSKSNVAVIILITCASILSQLRLNRELYETIN